MAEVRLLWPIENEDLTKNELIAEADPQVIGLCAELGQLPVGMAQDWRVDETAEGRPVLTCVVPVVSLVQARDGRVAEMWARWRTPDQIAAVLGCSATTVRRTVQRLGLTRPVEHSPEQTGLRDRVRRLYADGLVDDQIASVLGVGHATVWRIRSAELGLPAHGRGGRRREAAG